MICESPHRASEIPLYRLCNALQHAHDFRASDPVETIKLIMHAADSAIFPEWLRADIPPYLRQETIHRCCVKRIQG